MSTGSRYRNDFDMRPDSAKEMLQMKVLSILRSSLRWTTRTIAALSWAIAALSICAAITGLAACEESPPAAMPPQQVSPSVQCPPISNCILIVRQLLPHVGGPQVDCPRISNCMAGGGLVAERSDSARVQMLGDLSSRLASLQARLLVDTMSAHVSAARDSGQMSDEYRCGIDHLLGATGAKETVCWLRWTAEHMDSPAAKAPPAPTAGATLLGPAASASTDAPATKPPPARVRVKAVTATFPAEVAIVELTGYGQTRNSTPAPSGEAWMIVKATSGDGTDWSGFAIKGAKATDAQGKTYSAKAAGFPKTEGDVEFYPQGDYVLGNSDTVLFLFSISSNSKGFKFTVGDAGLAIPESPRAGKGRN